MNMLYVVLLYCVLNNNNNICRKYVEYICNYIPVQVCLSWLVLVDPSWKQFGISFEGPIQTYIRVETNPSYFGTAYIVNTRH